MGFQVAAALFMAAFELLFFAGLFSGWPAILPMLIEEGYFSDGCPLNTTSSQDLCQSQMESLNLVYTIASSSAPILALAFGYMLDKTGGWMTRTLLILIESIAFLILSVSSPSSSWINYIAWPMIHIAGSGMMTCNLQIPNLYERGRHTIIAILCGCMGTAVLVFLVINKLYFAGLVSFRAVCIFFTCLSVVFHVNTFILTPRYPTPRKLPVGYVFGYKELDCFKTDLPHTELAEEQVEPEEKVMATTTLRECVRDPLYWSNVFHFSILGFTVMFFVGNWYSWIADIATSPEQIDTFTTVINVAMATGAFVSAISGFCNDYLIRYYSRRFPLKIASMKAASIAFLIADSWAMILFACSLINNANLQYLTLISQALTRTFLFPTNASFITINYPEKNFGVLFNLQAFVNGLILLLQYPLTLVATRIFGGSFTVMFAIMLGVSALCVWHPLFLRYTASKRMKEISDDEMKMERL